jgi:uncharacterized protein YaiE (UPF0345 family)
MKILDNIKLLSLVVGLTAVAALTIPSAHAGTMSLDSVGYLLTLTENSSTSLTYTYTGPSTFNITPNGPDDWTLTVATGSCTFFLPMTTDWTEPENSQEVNEVMSTSSTSLHITSDESVLIYYGGSTTTVPDSTTVPGWGTDGGVPISIKFVDLASQAEANNGVPETGSTFALSAISVIGLLSLTRFRGLQIRQLS